MSLLFFSYSDIGNRKYQEDLILNYLNTTILDGIFDIF